MSDIRWEGFSHQEIYDAVHRGPGRGVSAPAEQVWAETEALILRVDQRIAAAMAGSSAGWEGAAAEAARGAVTPLGRWALDAANDAKVTAQAVAAQGEQAAHVRVTMPEPVTKQWNAEVGKALTDPTYLFHGLDDLHAVEQDAANRAARAVELMNTYTNNSHENRRNMDDWTLPPQVTVVTDVAGAGGAPAGPGGSPAVPVEAAGASAALAPAPASAGVPGGGPAGAPNPAGPPPVPGGVVPPVVTPGGSSSGAGGEAGAAPARAPASPGGSAPGGRAAPPGTTAPAALPSVTAPARPDAPVLSRPAPGGEPAPNGRPVVPGPVPRAVPATGWRDVVAAGSSTRVPAPDVADRALPPPAAGRAAVVDPPLRSVPPGERPGSPIPDPAARAAGSHPSPRPVLTGATSGLYPPPATAGLAAQERERRRPDYLLDDSDAFADDRWFPPSVITPDDEPPR